MGRGYRNPIDDMTEEELKACFTVTEEGKQENESAAHTQSARPVRGKVAGKLRAKGKFIMFPVEWESQLARVDADKCAYRVALYLLHEVWRSGRDHVKLANVGLKKLGIGRKGKRHALEQLEMADLIRVEREDRKSPVARVKHLD
jgi:hypothetical protein